MAPTLTVYQPALLLRTPSPIAPGKEVTYWNLQWDIPPGWVSYLAPPTGVRGNDSVSGGIALSCCKLGLLKHTVAGVEHVPLEEGEGGDPSLAYPGPQSISRAWQCCFPPPADMDGTFNQLKS